MPRREKADPFLARVGARIRELRQAQKLTLEKLAWYSVGSKGYVSDIENGLASASLSTLKKIADTLEVTVADLVTLTPTAHTTAADRSTAYAPSPRSGRKRKRPRTQ